jgi:hypothetical protein
MIVQRQRTVLSIDFGAILFYSMFNSTVTKNLIHQLTEEIYSVSYQSQTSTGST